MTTKTNLIGGLIFIGIISSTLNLSTIIEKITSSDFNSSTLSIMVGIILALFSVPVGYLINQIWMVFYNLIEFLGIFSFEKEDDFLEEYLDKIKKSSRWGRSTLYEVKLAICHRENGNKPLNHKDFIDWYRNKLNTIHSNGVCITSIILGFLFSFLLTIFRESFVWLQSYLLVSKDYFLNRYPFMIIGFILIVVGIFRIIYIKRVLRNYNIFCLKKDNNTINNYFSFK